MDLSAVIRTVRSQPWAIHPEVYCRIIEIIERRRRGEHLSDEEIKVAVAGRRPPAGPSRNGRVGVMSLRGPIAHRMNMMVEVSGGTSTELFARDFKVLAADRDIDSIIIDVDSPGGSVAGVPELSALVHEARGSKRTITVANDWAASAAYWIASAAREIVVTPSGEVGSIGVYASHTDISKADELAGIRETLIAAGKYKTEGNPFEPLGDEARAEMARKVDHYYDLFVRDVARNRRTTLTRVREEFGEGRMVTAAEAVRRGMADRIGSLDDILGELGADMASMRPAAAAPGIRERRQRMREREAISSEVSLDTAGRPR